jgi:hypothetical protein
VQSSPARLVARRRKEHGDSALRQPEQPDLLADHSPKPSQEGEHGFPARAGGAEPSWLFNQFRSDDFSQEATEFAGDAEEFDIANPQDRTRYLLAVSGLEPSGSAGGGDGPGTHLRAILPARGLEAARAQIQGNSVLSSLYRPHNGLDIRVPINASFRSAGEFGERAGKILSENKGKILKGSIVIKSPSRSLGTADQAPEPGMPFDSADFPARITYAINYDIFINEERFVEDQAGIAIAVGAEEVPPRDVKVAFEKPQAGLVAGRYIEFSSGCCTGMEEIPILAYREGLNFGRYWRTVPLDPDKIGLRSAGGQFEDYNPQREY